MSRFVSLLSLGFSALLTAMPASSAAEQPLPSPLWNGVLQDHPEHWRGDYQAGARVVVLEPVWNRYEPRPNNFDVGYISGLKKRLRDAQAAGFRVILSPGWQYPPVWLYSLPHSRYIDQFGVAFDDPTPGMNGANAVFNSAVREREAIYLSRLLADLGTDFLAIRLGGGWYNELNYPPHRFGDHMNCYWGYDDLAQGRAKGLPEGITPCPVQGWRPGEPDVRKAFQFAEWYLDSLKNYHDWQIATARRFFGGPLAMLYPSWGIRSGQLASAVAGGLSGKTSAEVNGEVPRGFDFARYVGGITDPGVIVYCTWVDARFGDDASTDPAEWRPVHHLASLARKNPLHLAVWGENTGAGDAAAMDLCFQQVRNNGLLGLVWAFEKELYDGRHATLSHFAEGIASSSGERP